ncbi:MAG: hypothetical protein CM1200mP40_02910 [Gammaproteobacteria bacterium]|nr:MAG: hypothetical protein CM1200mP40_02910 [Gammaproteobacteria bacterium]
MKAFSKVFLLLYSCASFGLTFANTPTYTQLPFTLPVESEQLIVADLNGDSLNELITVIDESLRIYFQREDGFDFDNGFKEIDFSGQAVGWDLSTNYGDNDRASIIALVNGTDAYVWPVEDEAIQEPQLIKSGLQGFLSKGVNRLYFSRDINGDSYEDLIIPGAGNLHVFIAGANYSYQSGLTIESENRMRTMLQPNALERRTGQAVRIPFMELRDVNSDGYDDLISRTDERLDVFIADEIGDAYFSSGASYSIDIAEIEERLGDFDIDNLDFSNLTGVLALTHEEVLDDVDGDGIEDLLLREGGKVSLFGGTYTGMNLEQPRQVLRSGGNVLSTFLYDENGDGLKDLWLWRVEPISVGDIFVWLAISGSVAIEAFVYPNDGERFARRPARKLTVDLRFPSVIRLATTFQDLASEAREIHTDEFIPTNVGNLDDAFDQEDLLVLVNNQVELFLNSIEPEDDSEEFLGALDYSRDQDSYEINLREIIDNIVIGGNPHLTLIDDRNPDIVIDLGTTAENGDIIPVRLNADSLDDVFVFTQHDSSQVQGILLLSN